MGRSRRARVRSGKRRSRQSCNGSRRRWSRSRWRRRSSDSLLPHPMPPVWHPLVST